MKLDVQFGTYEGRPSVLTVGSYDGVHLGHMDILNTVVSEAKKGGLISVVASFDPHPREVLTGVSPDMLSPVAERTRLLRNLPIDAHVLIPFTKAMAAMEASDYVNRILVEQLGVRVMVVGYDHRYGHNRMGDTDLLRKIGAEVGFSVIECGKVEVGETTVSSSNIRLALGQGDVRLAASLIGRRYDLTGIVIHGAGRGKGIGVPTANIGHIPEHKLIPRGGVYAVQVFVSGEPAPFGGMMNIGTRPTFNQQKTTTIEVNLFEFDGDLYDREVRVEFVQWVREEQKFASVEALIEQLNEDRERCTRLLRSLS